MGTVRDQLEAAPLMHEFGVITLALIALGLLAMAVVEAVAAYRVDRDRDRSFDDWRRDLP